MLPIENNEENEPKLTLEFLKNLLKSNKKYYTTPELNDSIYLHFKGFRKIENLHTFTGLKSLYMENNLISKIEGLEKCTNLICLYLHENCIEKIENLNTLVNLRILNLCGNRIKTIENLHDLVSLENLRISQNLIGKNGLADLKNLTEIQNLKILDISKNYIENPDAFQEVFMKMPKLQILYFNGNEAVNKIQNYRKFVISSLKKLINLDDTPIYEDDRRFAEAFMRGGLAEERKERDLYKKEQENIAKKHKEEFENLIENYKKEKSEEEKKNIEKPSETLITELKNENTDSEKIQEKDIPELETVKKKCN